MSHTISVSLALTRMNTAAVFACLSLSLICSASAPAQAQSNQSAALASSFPAAEAVPGTAAAEHSVVRWAGTLGAAAGRTVEIQFAIYADQEGGLALWNESQQVNVGPDGHYSVLLGAATADGLPQALFPSGEPRWVEARSLAPAGAAEAEFPRSLLAAVPYAFKAVDAETLAGRAAADYVTREDLKAATTAVPALTAPASILTAQPNLAGTGATNYLPIWTNSTTLGNSTVYENSTSVGIGTTTPATTLDVNGATTLRGTTYLPALGTSTSSTGYGSRILQFGANSWSSSSSVNVPQTFQLEALPVGNNTASPSANLSLFYAVGTATPKATGLSFGPTGLITFASGQKFAGAGTITGITASSPLTGGGTSGTVTVGLNTSALETTLNATYPTLTTYNRFTGGNTFEAQLTGNSGNTAYAIQGNTNAGIGVQGRALSTSGRAVEGDATGNGSIAVYANATGAVNGSTYPIGVYAHVGTGTGIKAVLDTAKIGQTAILGQTGGASAQYTSFLSDGLVAGVWGDTANSSTEVPMAIAGTADNGYAGVFENTSTTWSTLYVYNKGGGSTGINAISANTEGLPAIGHFDALMAGNSHGTCGIGGAGDLSCTGQIKSLVATRTGARTLETYSVQSPENWMEDFGSDSLKSGSVIVRIDPDFAETVSNSADYRIFLTPNGDSKGLYVTNKTPTSFEVRESGGGTASISFDYRIVAKRRGLEAQRLTDVTEKFNAEMNAASKHLQPTKSAR